MSSLIQKISNEEVLYKQYKKLLVCFSQIAYLPRDTWAVHRDFPVHKRNENCKVPFILVCNFQLSLNLSFVICFTLFSPLFVLSLKHTCCLSVSDLCFVRKETGALGSWKQFYYFKLTYYYQLHNQKFLKNKCSEFVIPFLHAILLLFDFHYPSPTSS